MQRPQCLGKEKYIKSYGMTSVVRNITIYDSNTLNPFKTGRNMECPCQSIHLSVCQAVSPSVHPSVHPFYEKQDGPTVA